jgi:hypothetical protein
MHKPTAMLIFASALLLSNPAGAEFITSFQGSAVFSGYNNIRLPGDSGTKLSYSDDLRSDPVLSPRLEIGYQFLDRHFVGLMASLLRLKATGTLDRDISFDGKIFPAGTEAAGHYQFDSYRFTYRYMFFADRYLKVGAGITTKLRIASSSLKGGGQQGELTNTGLVPLINFNLEWIVIPTLSFLVYGDMLTSAYGRAEDIFFGPIYRLNKNIGIMAGYRILEGGANNKKVYTFALFHYAVLGIEARFL